MVDDAKKKEQANYRTMVDRAREAAQMAELNRNVQNKGHNIQKEIDEQEQKMGFKFDGEKGKGHIQTLKDGSMNAYTTWETAMMNMVAAMEDFSKLLQARMAKKYGIYDPNILKDTVKDLLFKKKVDPEFSFEMAKDKDGNLTGPKMHAATCDLSENDEFHKGVDEAFKGWAKEANIDITRDQEGWKYEGTKFSELSEEKREELMTKVEDPKTGFATKFAENVAAHTDHNYKVGKYEPKEEVKKNENKDEPERPAPQ